MDAMAVADATGLSLECVLRVYDASTVEADLDAFFARGDGPYGSAAAMAAKAVEAVEAAPSSAEDDASLALALSLQMEEEDAEERRRGVAAAADEASLDLVRKLQQDEEALVSRRGDERKDAGDQLRRHLFAAGDVATTAPTVNAPPSTWAAGLSYAAVAGAGDACPAEVNSAAQGLGPPVRPTPWSAQKRSAAALSAPPLPARPPPMLVIDGANVAFNYGRETSFDPRGIRLAVDYFLRRSHGRKLRANELAVVLSECRWDASNAELAYLERLGCLTLTPAGKDDDVFLLQCAADHDAWAVSNDNWRDHRAARHATERVRKRKIRYAFCGDAFSPAADDLGRFDRQHS